MEQTPAEIQRINNIDRAEARLKQALDKIRTKTVEELRSDEIRFLRARASYLTLDDKEKYKSILVEKKEK